MVLIGIILMYFKDFSSLRLSWALFALLTVSMFATAVFATNVSGIDDEDAEDVIDLDDDTVNESEVESLEETSTTEIFSPSITFFNNELTLNGLGIRNRFSTDIYEIGLYLLHHEDRATVIVADNKPMALRLRILSDMLTKENMGQNFTTNFMASNGEEGENFEQDLTIFIAVLTEQINVGDVFDFFYDPQKGIVIYYNGQQKQSVGNLEFKEALFNMWLGASAPDRALKQDLLGG